jgi:hypothetical protein
VRKPTLSCNSTDKAVTIFFRKEMIMFKIIKNIFIFIFDVLTIIFEFTIGWLMLGLFYLSYIIQDFYEDKIKTLPEKIFIRSTKYFIREQLYKYPILTEHKIKIKYFYIPFKKNNSIDFVNLKLYF